MAIIYIPTIFLAKLSILLLYFRIFVTIKGSKTYYAIHFIIWFNLLFYLSNLPAEIWTCIPREKLWDPTIDGKCLNNAAIITTGGVINVVSDFMILSIPLVSIGRLQMPRAKKIGVSAVFATGSLQVLAPSTHMGKRLTFTVLVSQASCILSQPSNLGIILIKRIACSHSHYGRTKYLSKKIDYLFKAKSPQHCRASLRRYLQFPTYHAALLSARRAQDHQQALFEAKNTSPG